LAVGYAEVTGRRPGGIFLGREPLIDLAEGFLPPGAIPLLKAASELIPAAFNLGDVIF